MQLSFKGWRLRDGTIIREHVEKDEDDNITMHVRPQQHEAGLLRTAAKIKGKMTPQYDRA